MKQLSVLFVVFTAVLMGCSAEVVDQSATGDDGHNAFDPQISVGVLPPSVELTVTNGEPAIQAMTPAAGDVDLGAQDALFLEYTLDAKSHLLTVDNTQIILESPVGGALVDAGGTPYFSDARLAIGVPAKVLQATVTVTQAALILDFSPGIRVVPGNPLAVALYLDVANPAPPEDTALTFKGYVARLTPVEEGDVQDFGPGPWAPPLPAATILPINQVEQDSIKGGPQTPVPSP